MKKCSWFISNTLWCEVVRVLRMTPFLVLLQCCYPREVWGVRILSYLLTTYHNTLTTHSNNTGPTGPATGHPTPRYDSEQMGEWVPSILRAYYLAQLSSLSLPYLWLLPCQLPIFVIFVSRRPAICLTSRNLRCGREPSMSPLRPSNSLSFFARLVW